MSTKTESGAKRGVPFATAEPIRAADLRPWLVDAAGGFAGQRGADVALRIELDPPAGAHASATTVGDAAPDPGRRRRKGHGQTDRPAPSARAVLQLTSRAETSLIVDAADLYVSPVAVVSRFGDDAETDLLRALRRGARAWAPLEPLLHERAPTGLDLDDDLLAELLADGATLLQGTGLEVLWPSEILADGIELRASIVPTPGVVMEAGFSLDTLVEFRWQATLHGELLSEEEVDQLAEAKRGLVRLRGRWVAADPALLERLKARRQQRLTAAEALGALLAGTVDLDGEAVAVVAEGPLADLAERLSALTETGHDQLGVPPGLATNVELRPYQLRGVTWLHAMTDAGLGGCLADDMGLGKTVQTLALLLAVKNEDAKIEGKRKPFKVLIVAPTSVVTNWLREMDKFAPSLRHALWHGAERKERQDEFEDAEVVVTSYALLRRDEELLKEIDWRYVIVDEAQQIKNPLSATARAAKRLRADRRLALSGTPIENRLSEIWSIFDFVSPGLLGPLDKFEERYSRPIDAGDKNAAARLRAAIHPFILRRTKSEVAKDLPEKIETDQFCELTGEQAALYAAVLKEVRQQVLGEVERHGLARSHIMILAGLTRLRQAACDPRLLGLPREFGDEDSGKLVALRDLVETSIEGGHKVLVFSQFVSMLQIVKRAMDEDGVAYEYLDGSTKDRIERVDHFQRDDGPPVFLISLKAGGSGLNLTAADTVIHFDPWWNPAVEDQATDRAHRIGQTKVVTTYRLIAKGTIEEKILELAEKKRELVGAVLSEDVGGAKKLTKNDLEDLFKADD